jgi:hypothetical protein
MNEREAWQQYASMAVAGFCAAPHSLDLQARAQRAADVADLMLALERERFERRQQHAMHEGRTPSGKRPRP